MNLPIQKAIEGKYEILEKIGEGGIGSVYKVRHRLLEEIRVIKVLRSQAATQHDLQERFLHEARMAIRMKHPNIAQLHDFSITEEGTAYIVMEYIDGIGVDALLEAAGPPSVDLTLEISRQALAALGYLHAHRFVHRDVSPDNLMLTRAYDGRPLVKLIDLGIAKNLEGEMHLTATGVFVGKVRYSSPEQFSAQSGGDELDHRSDIYSFGVLLYELLTGQMPIAGETFSEVAGGHLFTPPRPFHETDPDGRLSDGLRAAVLRSLAKEPARRFPTAEEFAQTLERFRRADAELGAELDRLVATTAAALPRPMPIGKPGSTQSRLDREFGLDTTPSPQPLPAIGKGRTTIATVPLQVGKVVDRRTVVAEPPPPPSGAGSRSARWLIAGLGAAALLAAGLGGWWLWNRSVAPEAPAPEETLTVQPIARWTPPERELGLSVPEPPPFEEGARGDSAVARPPRPAVEPPVSESEAGEPASEEPQPAEGDESTTPEPQAEPPTTPEIYAEGAVGVVPPVLLDLPSPVAPEADVKKETLIVVRVLVNEFGEATNPSVVRGPMFKKRLKEAAMEAAGQARFRPAMKDGVAGRMWADVRVVFRPG